MQTKDKPWKSSSQHEKLIKASLLETKTRKSSSQQGYHQKLLRTSKTKFYKLPPTRFGQKLIMYSTLTKRQKKYKKQANEKNPKFPINAPCNHGSEQKVFFYTHTIMV